MNATVFRQAGMGVSLVTDAYGRVISRVDVFEESEPGFTGIQMVETPMGSVDTIYPAIGDGFGQAMVFGMAGLWVGLWAARKKRFAG
jgi:hypothetical protein